VFGHQWQGGRIPGVRITLAMRVGPQLGFGVRIPQVISSKPIPPSRHLCLTAVKTSGHEMKSSRQANRRKRFQKKHLRL
jgi:hypothetical protein